ncbi:MAG: hypothetical protein ACOVO1_05435 [Chitinophagaceae bacterium]
MKKIYAILLLLLAASLGFSQSRFTVTQLNKKDVPGVVGEIPFVESTVREAIDKNFEKLGYKGKKFKDFVVYSGVVLKELDNQPHDIYVLVDRKSRQEKEVSLVTFLIGKGFDNFASDTADAELINQTKLYINSLRDVAAAYDLELQITAQEDLVKKSDRKLENLADENNILQKRKKKIEEDIAQNIAEQNSQKVDNERQKQILSTLKTKRKPIVTTTN